MPTLAELKRMILEFRVTELQVLLSFAGRSKSGRKHELVQRALELCTINSNPLVSKIIYLYNTMLEFSPTRRNANRSRPMESSEMDEGEHEEEYEYEEEELGANPTFDENDTQNRDSEQEPQSNAQGQEEVVQDPQDDLGLNPVFLPVNPEVTYTNLPFYNVLYEVVKPTSLLPQACQFLQKTSFVFHLTDEQVLTIALAQRIRPYGKEPAVQCHLRFCLLDVTSTQDDRYPPGLIVRVNNRFCALKEQIPKKDKDLALPVDITSLLKVNTVEANTVEVQWHIEYGYTYVMGIFVVEKKSWDFMLSELKIQAFRDPFYTRESIKDKLREDTDSEITTTSLRVSLICPLKKVRLENPCKASTCAHLQCFDAAPFLKMNEKKPLWLCPICDRPAEFDQLIIDGYFEEIISSDRLPLGAREIELYKDGSWSAVNVREEPFPGKKQYFLVKMEQEKKAQMEAENQRNQKEKQNGGNQTTVEKVVPGRRSTALLPGVGSSSSDKSKTVGESSHGKRHIIEIDLTAPDSEDESRIRSKRRQSSGNKRNGVNVPNTNRGIPIVIDLESDSNDPPPPPHSLHRVLGDKR